MRQVSGNLTLHPRRAGLTDITADVVAWLTPHALSVGLLTVFCQHTSASLTIQENADPNARHDLETFFRRLVVEDPHLYAHNEEGPDDMPAHIRSALTCVNLSIPIQGGRLALGTWQGIYLFEHRSQPQPRNIILHALGD